MEEHPKIYVEDDRPIWVRENRAATEQEFGEWSRSQERACPEYIPQYPLSHYQGACHWYIWRGRKHCGYPFIPKMFCRSGVVPDNYDE